MWASVFERLHDFDVANRPRRYLPFIPRSIVSSCADITQACQPSFPGDAGFPSYDPPLIKHNYSPDKGFPRRGWDYTPYKKIRAYCTVICFISIFSIFSWSPLESLWGRRWWGAGGKYEGTRRSRITGLRCTSGVSGLGIYRDALFCNFTGARSSVLSFVTLEVFYCRS